MTRALLPDPEVLHDRKHELKLKMKQWELDYEEAHGFDAESRAVRFTTARVLYDVGLSAPLAWRKEGDASASAVLVLRRGEVVASGTYEKLEAEGRTGVVRVENTN